MIVRLQSGEAPVLGDGRLASVYRRHNQRCLMLVQVIASLMKSPQPSWSHLLFTTLFYHDRSYSAAKMDLYTEFQPLPHARTGYFEPHTFSDYLQPQNHACTGHFEPHACSGYLEPRTGCIEPHTLSGYLEPHTCTGYLQPHVCSSYL